MFDFWIIHSTSINDAINRFKIARERDARTQTVQLSTASSGNKVIAQCCNG